MVRFSVLVPVYNVASYLPKCLDSITGQTYKNLEIICIDDGSTDCSGEILDEYVRKDPRITVIHKANTGYGHSMNLGLKAAKGDYISIVESDDYIAEDLYEKLAAVIEAEGYSLDVVKTNHYRISDHEIRKRNVYTEEHCGRAMTVKDYPELFSLPCCIWGSAYRREFLDRWKIHFLETPGASYQDTSFMFKVWAAAERVYFIYGAYLFYRTDNINSSVNSRNKMFCICEEVAEIERYLDEHDLHDLYLEGGKGVFICRAYMWNYYRLHLGLRSAFWVEMTRKFREIAQSKGFSREYWVEQYWQEIHQVLADPEDFFWRTNGNLKNLDLEQYTANNLVYRHGILPYLQIQTGIIIYGAGTYGRRVFEFLCKKGLREKICGFAVTEAIENQETPERFSVNIIDTMLRKNPEALVIVAVAEKNQRPILEKLSRLECDRILRVDREWMELWKQENEYAKTTV